MNAADPLAGKLIAPYLDAGKRLAGLGVSDDAFDWLRGLDGELEGGSVVGDDFLKARQTRHVNIDGLHLARNDVRGLVINGGNPWAADAEVHQPVAAGAGEAEAAIAIGLRLPAELTGFGRKALFGPVVVLTGEVAEAAA